jgi:hypothetical protein
VQADEAGLPRVADAVRKIAIHAALHCGEDRRARRRECRQATRA